MTTGLVYIRLICFTRRNVEEVEVEEEGPFYVYTIRNTISFGVNLYIFHITYCFALRDSIQSQLVVGAQSIGAHVHVFDPLSYWRFSRYTNLLIHNFGKKLKFSLLLNPRPFLSSNHTLFTSSILSVSRPKIITAFALAEKSFHSRSRVSITGMISLFMYAMRIPMRGVMRISYVDGSCAPSGVRE